MLSFKKHHLLFMIIGAAGAALMLFFFLGILPAAKINNSFISLREFSKTSRGFLTFNKKTNQQIPDLLIKEGVLVSIFEDRIVEEELRQRNISKRMIEEALEKQLKNIPEEKLTHFSGLYGWDIKQFSDAILIPQARIDILADLLKQDSKDYDEWMREKFQGAKISLYFLPWKWNGQTLETK